MEFVASDLMNQRIDMIIFLEYDGLLEIILGETSLRDDVARTAVQSVTETVSRSLLDDSQSIEADLESIYSSLSSSMPIIASGTQQMYPSPIDDVELYLQALVSQVSTTPVFGQSPTIKSLTSSSLPITRNLDPMQDEIMSVLARQGQKMDRLSQFLQNIKHKRRTSCRNHVREFIADRLRPLSPMRTNSLERHHSSFLLSQMPASQGTIKDTIGTVAEDESGTISELPSNTAPAPIMKIIDAAAKITRDHDEGSGDRKQSRSAGEMKLRSPFRRLAVKEPPVTVAIDTVVFNDAIIEDIPTECDTVPVKRLKQPFKRHVLQPKSVKVNSDRPSILHEQVAEEHKPVEASKPERPHKMKRLKLSHISPLVVNEALAPRSTIIAEEILDTAEVSNTERILWKPFKRLKMEVTKPEVHSPCNTRQAITPPTSPIRKPGSVRARQSFRMPMVSGSAATSTVNFTATEAPTSGWETANGSHIHIDRDPALEAEWNSAAASNGTKQMSIDTIDDTKLARALFDQKLILQKKLSQLQEDLKQASAAQKIENKNEDGRLVELSTKWRTVSQQICDEIYNTMANKVEQAGGLANIGREGRLAQQWFESDEQEAAARKRQEEDEYELTREEKMAMGIEQDFSMDMMLQHLGIARETIQWDEMVGWY